MNRIWLMAIVRRDIWSHDVSVSNLLAAQGVFEEDRWRTTCFPQSMWCRDRTLTGCQRKTPRFCPTVQLLHLCEESRHTKSIHECLVNNLTFAQKSEKTTPVMSSRLSSNKSLHEGLCCKLGHRIWKIDIYRARKAQQRDTIGLHYGKWRVQCFWSTTQIKVQDISASAASILTILFKNPSL